MSAARIDRGIAAGITTGISQRHLENINTLDESGELMITLFASFAQEESRSISENCKWGIRKRFEEGMIGVANKHVLGYRYDDALKQYVIIPEEAETVRAIFSLFLNGASLRQICDALHEKGMRTITGRLFVETSVANILKHEIYAGDLRRQKTYTADPIGKRKVRNNGVLPQFYYRTATRPSSTGTPGRGRRRNIGGGRRCSPWRTASPAQFSATRAA